MFHLVITEIGNMIFKAPYFTVSFSIFQSFPVANPFPVSPAPAEFDNEHR